MSPRDRLTTREIDYILRYAAGWLYDSDTDLKIIRTRLNAMKWDPLFELNNSYENDISQEYQQLYGHRPRFQDPSPVFLQGYDKVSRTILTADECR